MAKAWDEGAFLEACTPSASIAEVLDRLGVSKFSGNYRRAAAYAERLGAVLPIVRRDAWRFREPRPILSDEQVRARFCRTGVAQDSKSLKRWMVRRLGVMNRLRLLCPNCHAQTETSNRKK